MQPHTGRNLPPTPLDFRTPALQEALREVEFALAFTRTYREAASASPAERECRCLSLGLPHVFEPLRPTDGFAGRIRMGAVGFSPEPGGFGYYLREDAFRPWLATLAEAASDSAASGLSPEAAGALMAEIDAMIAYWRDEQTSARVRSAYPPHVADVLPSDAWMTEPGVAFPLYRLAGMHLDYGRLVREGIPGLMDTLSERQATGGDADDPAFLSCARESLALLSGICRRYAREAGAMAESAGITPVERHRMLEIRDSLQRIVSGRPTCLRDAIQLVWLYALAAGVMNYGRMDVYLGDFLAADRAEGRLDPASAQEMVTSFWRLVAERNTTWNGRIILGGRGRRNPENADAFARLAIEATRVVPGSDPQLTLRWHEGMDAALLEQALAVLGEGRTFPMLYNDDVNIPAVMHAFRITEQEAEQYLPFGCGEYVIDHASLGTPSGVINLLKVVEITLRNGRDAVSGSQIGLATGELDSFSDFNAFFHAYARQVDHFMEALAHQQRIEYDVAGETAAFLLPGILFDDCVARGRPLLSGGVRHLGGTIETYGNINAANSLAAIRRMLFANDGKRTSDLKAQAASPPGVALTPDHLLKALDADFVGHEPLREALLACPKYGNDDAEADTMAVRVHEQVCHAARNAAQRAGLDSYLVVVINNSANTILGLHTAASPDGRNAGEPMANANNPWNGTDRNGLTAMLHSLVKLDPAIHAGAVQNIMLSPSLFLGGPHRVLPLVKAYFAMGGTQAMLSVVNHEDLRQAMETPERYGHLFVRVGGFSARFVDLDRNVQREILSRTQY